MMINHKDLPEELAQCIIVPDNLDELVSPLCGHSWTTLPLRNFLSNKGLMWFLNRKIILSPVAMLFRIQPNHEGEIHLDLPVTVGFNFVLRGSGTMQWIDIDAEEYTGSYTAPSGSSFRYSRFRDVKKITVTDEWTGTAGVVKIDTPHRIVSKDLERITLSFRLIKESTHTFESVIQTF